MIGISVRSLAERSSEGHPSPQLNLPYGVAPGSPVFRFEIIAHLLFVEQISLQRATKLLAKAQLATARWMIDHGFVNYIES
jgi:hypothetical protein